MFTLGIELVADVGEVLIGLRLMAGFVADVLGLQNGSRDGIFFDAALTAVLCEVTHQLKINMITYPIEIDPIICFEL